MAEFKRVDLSARSGLLALGRRRSSRHSGRYAHPAHRPRLKRRTPSVVARLRTAATTPGAAVQMCNEVAPPVHPGGPSALAELPPRADTARPSSAIDQVDADRGHLTGNMPQRGIQPFSQVNLVCFHERNTTVAQPHRNIQSIAAHIRMVSLNTIM